MGHTQKQDNNCGAQPCIPFALAASTVAMLMRIEKKGSSKAANTSNPREGETDFRIQADAHKSLIRDAKYTAVVRSFMTTQQLGGEG